MARLVRTACHDVFLCANIAHPAYALQNYSTETKQTTNKKQNKY